MSFVKSKVHGVYERGCMSSLGFFKSSVKY